MDKYDKMTDETLNEAYKKFLDGLKKEDNKKNQSDNTTYSYNRCDRPFIDKKTFINGYEIKPELMNKIKSFEDFNIFLENCKNNVIEESNRQKTASVLSKSIETNYDKKEIKLLVEYLQEMLKKSD